MAQIAAFRGVVADGKPLVWSEISQRPRDATRALYRYHQTFAHPSDGRALTRKAMIAAVRLVPWGEGSVRRVEESTPSAELAAKMRGGVEDEPVFAGYRDAAREIDRLFKRVETERPAVEHTTADGTVHRLWRLTSAEVFGSMRHVFAPKRVTILDGVERYEAGLERQDKLGSLAMYSAANYTMMCLVNLDDPALVPVGRHKLVHGVDKAAILDAAKPYFIVDKLPGVDPAKLEAALGESIGHQPAFVAVFGTDAWKLTLSPDIALTRQGVAVHRALQRFDPVVLDALVLSRLPKEAEVTTTTSTAAALAAGADLALIVRPVGVDQLSHAVDLGQLLPAGSTAFAAPALPFVGNVIDRDEDLV